MKKTTLVLAALLTGVLTLGGGSVRTQAAMEYNGNAIQYRNDTTGELQTGWKYFNGSWYYFDSVTKNALIGFQKLGNCTYYFDENGRMVTGITNINGNLYYFNSSGQQKLGTGWITYNNRRYYLNNSVLLKSCMAKIGTDYYYFDSNANMLTNSWKSYNGKWYFMKSDGCAYVSTLAKIGNCHYYFNAEGQMQTGWFKAASGETYYADGSGKILMNKMVDDHFLNSDGTMRRNSWLSYNYNWYFFDSEGNMYKNKFVKIGNCIYYFDPQGIMAVDFKDINGNTYYFGTNGVMVTGEFSAYGDEFYASTVSGIIVKNGWANEKQYDSYGRYTGIHSGWNNVEGNWYYYSSTGTKAVGFQKLGNCTYYFNPNGIMLVGLQTIGSDTYYFRSSGQMVTNETISIGDGKYTFGGDGKMTSYQVNNLGQQIVDFALQFVGNRYVYGGTSLTNGADCSGFTMSVLAHFGISVPHYTVSQMNDPKGYKFEPTLNNILPGDLLYYYSSTAPSHVAIYIGNGQVVHASNSQPYPKGGIKISTWNYTKPYWAVRFWS